MMSMQYINASSNWLNLRPPQGESNFFGSAEAAR
jgi:hypothetical protein